MAYKSKGWMGECALSLSLPPSPSPPPPTGWLGMLLSEASSQQDPI